MEVGEAIGIVLGVIIYLGFLVLSGFFIYWTARILIIIPDRLTRITEAFETIAKKLGER